MRLYIVLSFIFLNIFSFSKAYSQTDSSSIDILKPDSLHVNSIKADSVLLRNIKGDSVITRISIDSLKLERDRFDSLNSAMNDSLAIANNSDANNSPSVLPVTMGIAGFLYLFNPIILLENDKVALGITKEISIGFGDFGENRIAFEYSYLFRENSKNHFRFSIKHDFLLKDGIRASNLLQSTPVFSLGGGYFTDLTYNGFFPEVSYGISIRNHKLLLYPHVKLRYTFVMDPEHLHTNILDFSFGFIIGFANPFIDKKIRRNY